MIGFLKREVINISLFFGNIVMQQLVSFSV